MMEKHRVSSQGRYYVYRLDPIEVKGPFFPQSRTERIATFARETPGNPWKGAYYRLLPQRVRDKIEESNEAI